MRSAPSLATRPPWSLESALLKVLPPAARHAAYRGLVRVPKSPPADVCFEIARCTRDLEGAFKLLHDSWVNAGLMRPHASGMRITVFHALPSTSTVVCKRGDDVVATLSIMRESPLGFPLSRAFDVSRLKASGERLAELSCLAIHPSFKRDSTKILFPLFKYAYEYSTRYFAVDQLLIGVHPRHFDFYQAVFLLSPLEEKPVDYYDFAYGAPVKAGHMDLREVYKSLAVHYGRRPPSRNLFHYFMKLELDCFDFPDREFYSITDPVMTPKRLRHFFVDRTALFQELSDDEKNVISTTYSDPAYRGILPSSPATKKTRTIGAAPVFDVRLKGKLHRSGMPPIKLLVTRASVSGFECHVDAPMELGMEADISIAIGDFEVATVRGEPVERKSEKTYIFSLSTYGDRWESFIEHLSREFIRANRERSAMMAPLELPRTE